MLRDLLRVPGDEDRRRTSATLVTRGRDDYARGDFTSAYRSLALALAADPRNEKALADMPLVALKTGRFREAIAVAWRGIQSTSAPLQAAAWFNMGLICERDEVRNQDFGELSCDDDWVWPFVQAWQLQPTRARADKLLQVFARPAAGWCFGSDGEIKIWAMKTRNRLAQRIHILHQAGDSLEITHDYQQTRLIDNLAVQDRAITALERGPREHLPMINRRACRMPAADSAASQ